MSPTPTEEFGQLDCGRRAGAPVRIDPRHPEIEGGEAEGSKLAIVLENRKHATASYNSAYSHDAVFRRTEADCPYICRQKRVLSPFYNITPDCTRTRHFETGKSKIQPLPKSIPMRRRHFLPIPYPLGAYDLRSNTFFVANDPCSKEFVY